VACKLSALRTIEFKNGRVHQAPFSFKFLDRDPSVKKQFTRELWQIVSAAYRVVGSWFFVQVWFLAWYAARISSFNVAHMTNERHFSHTSKECSLHEPNPRFVPFLENKAQVVGQMIQP
jgi:hypothetical protein